jgi:hypothetical protein
VNATGDKVRWIRYERSRCPSRSAVNWPIFPPTPCEIFERGPLVFPFFVREVKSSALYQAFAPPTRSINFGGVCTHWLQVRIRKTFSLAQHNSRFYETVPYDCGAGPLTARNAAPTAREVMRLGG